MSEAVRKTHRAAILGIVRPVAISALSAMLMATPRRGRAWRAIVVALEAMSRDRVPKSMCAPM